MEGIGGWREKGKDEAKAGYPLLIFVGDMLDTLL
jgi:hypothetical protein